VRFSEGGIDLNGFAKCCYGANEISASCPEPSGFEKRCRVVWVQLEGSVVMAKGMDKIATILFALCIADKTCCARERLLAKGRRAMNSRQKNAARERYS
jgi:hypothetical protein